MSSFKANMMIKLFNQMNVNQWDVETYVKRLKIGPSINPPLRMKQKFQIKEVYKDCFEVIPKSQQTQTVMIYFHGGAYVGGLTKTQWKFACDIAKDNHCIVYVIDYRLTPIFHYQDTISHALNIYQDIIQLSSVNECILIGDSAGGGLAISLCQAIREANLKQPKSVIALCPWLDLTMSHVTKTNDLILNKAFLNHYALVYSSHEPNNPLASPIMIDCELPPIHMLSCTGDILNKEAREFKDKQSRSGIEMDYYEQEGMFHTYFLFSLKESKPVFDWIKKAVSKKERKYG